MMFVYKQWDIFCKNLKDNGINSISAMTLQKTKIDHSFLILKHDVETSPSKALRLAQIESKYAQQGSYYVQAYLLKRKKNINILRQIQKLGHEVSYHHDVMDSNKGNLYRAQKEFLKNVELFEKNNFTVETVCQHGNPIIERVGYSSNRDFFRDISTAKMFHNISDIMVNFKSKINKNFKYISDAGYGWKIIYDFENNDIIESAEKDITLYNLDEVINLLKMQNSFIISTHPHRWHNNIFLAKGKNIFFNIIKSIAKFIIKVPLIKKIVGRFYYLAKKI